MIKMIVAIAANNVIGKDNDLIWHLPADMRFFTESTSGHIVIMGRKNWNSIPDKYRPLSNRLNIVVSRDPNFTDEGCEAFTSIEEAIEKYKNDERDIFIIGGGQIYKYSLDNELAEELLITRIDHSFEGDTYFPEIDENKWNKSLLFEHQIDEKNKYPFTVWKYSKN
ncbi:dihydrofolate reductase [Paracrocinitomix mangrovi]|uniref:dihydrofolate reductase n=1 Tax=Paracrocinitomix mangrovi TaxID=2862509 RepID=UPI001C8E03F8|nr:dihydrofolate reductase [Paracrocinitomix mangrovi]UKN00543.1 dihydrofolate reductase [Paracrocinitomix mangrovi]